MRGARTLSSFSRSRRCSPPVPIPRLRAFAPPPPPPPAVSDPPPRRKRSPAFPPLDFPDRRSRPRFKSSPAAAIRGPTAAGGESPAAPPPVPLADEPIAPEKVEPARPPKAAKPHVLRLALQLQKEDVLGPASRRATMQRLAPGPAPCVVGGNSEEGGAEILSAG